ncbi:hypothetical protein HELRODRAFT_111663 [Helobdella robusta]|uniref:SNARE-complex protein Syntaxin-18 N-terminal domain-containing protein n=1 Tax=Helobdella robusta TaxID=6412 RepID=T1EFD4_HELRO|nr:hypothetical protein HELRODRAFT_111663 [Helobdella robusta]ESO04657.1 hypothetical protein HELRODRAFT_111663 [Helobdella robusta]
MSDITNLFKATIKTVKIREKNLQSSSFSSSATDKAILPKSNINIRKSEFAVTAKNVVLLITKLKNFLLENRKDYISASEQMTNIDRDRIDAEAEAFMKMSQDAINQLKVQANANKVLRQTREHIDHVLILIEQYLFAVCRLYSEQKALRVKRTIHRKKISRLQTEPATIKLQVPPNDKKVKNSSPDIDDDKKSPSLSSSPPPSSSSSSPKISSPKNVDDDEDDEDDDSMSYEEKMMLQKENDILYAEKSSIIEEIKRVEGDMIEISKLQRVFSENILQQDVSVQKLADNILGSNENLKEGNELIREAMKNNAGFRVWIMFILIVFAFSILFLDWYNP